MRGIIKIPIFQVLRDLILGVNKFLQTLSTWPLIKHLQVHDVMRHFSLCWGVFTIKKVFLILKIKSNHCLVHLSKILYSSFNSQFKAPRDDFPVPRSLHDSPLCPHLCPYCVFCWLSSCHLAWYISCLALCHCILFQTEQLLLAKSLFWVLQRIPR